LPGPPLACFDRCIVAGLQHPALRDSKAGINLESAMSNQEWWAAERKAAEFWRKVKENQMAEEKHRNHVRYTAPVARIRNFGTPMRRQSFGF
jgi:hypothetical protein